MTILKESKVFVEAAGNGTASLFSISPLKLYQRTDIAVYLEKADKSLSLLSEGAGAGDYSVEVSNYPGTGSVKYPSSGTARLKTGEKLYVMLNLPLEQALELSHQGAYNPEDVESALDKLVQLTKQQQDELARRPGFPANVDRDSIKDVELPLPESGRILGVWETVRAGRTPKKLVRGPTIAEIEGHAGTAKGHAGTASEEAVKAQNSARQAEASKNSAALEAGKSAASAAAAKLSEQNAADHELVSQENADSAADHEVFADEAKIAAVAAKNQAAAEAAKALASATASETSNKASAAEAAKALASATASETSNKASAAEAAKALASATKAETEADGVKMLNNRGEWVLNASPLYARFDQVIHENSGYYWNRPVAGNSEPSLTNTDWAPLAVGPELPKRNYVFKDVVAEKAYAAATDIHISDMDVTITANPGNPILYWLNYNFEAFAGAMFYFKVKVGTAAPVEIWSPTNAGARIAGSGVVPYDGNEASTLQALSYFNMYTTSITAETQITFSLHVRFQSAKAMFQNRTISDLNTNVHERATSRVYVEEIHKESVVAHADAKERTDPIIVLDSGEPAATLGALYSMLFVIDGGKVQRKSALGWETLGYLLWGKFNNLLDGQSAIYDARTKRWVNSWPVQVARIETDKPSDSLAINTLAINEKSGKGFLRKADGTWETVFHMTPRAHASIALLKYRRAWNADNVFYEQAKVWQSLPLDTIAMNSGNEVMWLRNNQFRLKPGKYAISVLASIFSEGRKLDRTKSPVEFQFTEHARIKAILRLILGHKQMMLKGQLCQGWNFGEMTLDGELNLTNEHECEIQALNWRGYSWDTDPANASRDTTKPIGTSDRVAFGGASGDAAYGDQDDVVVRIQKIGVADPIEDYSLRNKMIVGYSHIQLWSDAEDLGPAVLDRPGETEVYFIQKRPNVNLRVIQFDLTTAGDVSNFSDNDKFFERGSADKISTLIWNAARNKMALFTPDNGRFHLYNINRPGELETTQPNPTTKDIALQTNLTYRNAQFSANHSKLFVLASNATSFTIRVYELPTAGDISSITTTSGVTTHTFAESINPSYFTIVNDQEIFMLYGTDASHQNEIIHYRLATPGDFTPTAISQVGAADAIDGVNLKSIQWIDHGRKLIAMDDAENRIIELGHL